MYIRQIKKKRSDKAQTFYQYSLVQNTRIGQRVKQENILYLGSEAILADKQHRKLVAQAMKAMIYGEQALFPADLSSDLANLVDAYYAKYLVKYPEGAQGKTPQTIHVPPKREEADLHEVDINTVQVSEVKSFGAEHLCHQVAGQLDLAGHLKACGFSEGEASLALAAILSRAIFTSSEWRTAQLLEDNSSLCELLGMKQAPSHKHLYAIADQLYEHRDELDKRLYTHIKDLFNLEDKIVIFDLSNTYFETSKRDSELARYGRSKEKRSDCPLVVFTAVINQEGFIRHSRVYEGNKPDVASLPDMIADLEKHYSPQDQSTGKKPTLVMDVGIATEENLEIVQEKGYSYVCVARDRLKDYTVDTEALVSTDTQNGGQVHLQKLARPDSTDTWLYVHSPAKEQKEQSMSTKLTARFEEQISDISAAIHKKGGTKAVEKVWERIGRAKQKHRLVSHLYQINVEQQDGKATHIHWERKPPSKTRQDKEKGVYFIRTNLETESETQLWDIYNTIREVEATFRCLKTDLDIRPIHHQKDQRIRAHIYLTTLAYQLVNTIRHQTKKAGIHDSWQNILRKANTQNIQNVELPTQQKTIHLRKPSKPIKALKEIYQACHCQHDIKAIRKYVVYH